MAALFKLIFLSSILVASLLVLWWVLARIGLPIPAPPLDFAAYVR